jgi:histidinol phosphatase-like PHP family hydrolase
MPHSVVYDFHMHTVLSDGDLVPTELIRRCIANGYGGMVTADHCGAGMMERVLVEGERDCALVREHWGFEAYAGVELTHVPASSVSELAARAKACGAALVVVHGESPVEPVDPGTNLAAASCPDVDILAHPGLLTPEAAAAARDNGVFIEVTARQGHGMANGHVVRAALEAGAGMVVNSDAHSPRDILTPQWAEHVARCAGLPEELLETVLIANPQTLLGRARENLAKGGGA